MTACCSFIPSRISFKRSTRPPEICSGSTRIGCPRMCSRPSKSRSPSSTTCSSCPHRMRIWSRSTSRAAPWYGKRRFPINETLALNPETGNLVWHFAHLPNDQWDMDWAFERVIVTLGQGAGARRAVVTSGKEGIHDIVELNTGKYISSISLGLQNIVTAIDPVTGAKTIDQKIVPGDGRVKFVCPDSSGGKNFTPSGYNPHSHLMFVPFAETCMDLIPVAAGERGLLSTGVRMAIRPRPNSDGLYGRLQAINLETGKTAWVTPHRTPILTRPLATAGGLVFAGSVDRSFSAYDDATGKRLWSTRLSDVPNSNPISYELNGKQYVAIVVGSGGYP